MTLPPGPGRGAARSGWRAGAAQDPQCPDLLTRSASGRRTRHPAIPAPTCAEDSGPDALTDERANGTICLSRTSPWRDLSWRPDHHESRHTSRLSENCRHLQLWRAFRDRLHAERTPANRRLLPVSSFLHWQAEDRGHCRPGRPLPQEIRYELRGVSRPGLRPAGNGHTRPYHRTNGQIAGVLTDVPAGVPTGIQ